MNLKHVHFGTVDKFHVVVEIPKGSGIKYEYDEKMRVFVPKFFWRDGVTLPYNYRFVAETAAEDNDHLDVIILGDDPIIQGAVVECVAIGILKLLDRGVPDHKIIALPTKHPLIPSWDNIDTLSPGERHDLERKIVNILNEMARQKNKIIEIQGFFGKEEAKRELECAHRKFDKEKAVSFL